MRTLTPWGSMAQTPGVEVSVRRSSLAGDPPFHTTQTKAVEFPGAALSPACRRQAAGEGAGLDATSPQSFRETPTSVRDPAYTRSFPGTAAAIYCPSQQRHSRAPSPANPRQSRVRRPELQMQQQPQNQSTSRSTTAVVSSPVAISQSQPHKLASMTPRERVGHSTQLSEVSVLTSM